MGVTATRVAAVAPLVLVLSEWAYLLVINIRIVDVGNVALACFILAVTTLITLGGWRASSSLRLALLWVGLAYLWAMVCSMPLLVL